MSDTTLILGDCLDRMSQIADGSVDLICADLPYGITDCKWDVVIPFKPLWAHYKRVLKPRGAVVLTAKQPFTSMLVMSNPGWFRYCLVWDKKTASDPLNARRRPMSCHEDIVLFSPHQTTYRPILEARTLDEIKSLSIRGFQDKPSPRNAYGETNGSYVSPRALRTHKSPKTIIHINGLSGKHRERGFHPTQKPVALMEHLIYTYSNPGETVLDNTMGSGTTGLACINTDRRFIGIEKDPAYFEIAEARLAAHRVSMPLLTGVAP